MGAFKDLTGQQFNSITVLYYNKELSKKEHHTYWHCKCECGREKDIRADYLSTIKTCGACTYDLVGKRFGRLLVINKDHVDKNGHQYYLCKCDCGNLVVVNSDALRRNLTTSCGCYHSEITHKRVFRDLTGQRFGQLTAIKPIFNKNAPVEWLCQCDCGSTTTVRGANLKTGHTISCGCIRSKGEKVIRNWLNEHNYIFKTEYRFKELPNRRFDFALFKNDKLRCIIEFDGKQHYSYIATWHKTQEDFKKSQLRDNEKTQFCQDHDIPLYRIKYDEDIEKRLEQIVNEIKE